MIVAKSVLSESEAATQQTNVVTEEDAPIDEESATDVAQEEEEEFESPFADRDDDFNAKPTIFKQYSSNDIPEREFYFRSKNYEDSETESTKNSGQDR